MATNKVQEGKIVDLLLGITAVSGDPVAIGAFRGVALSAGSAGATVPVDIDGVYDLSTKAAALANSAGSGVAISIGTKIWYNSALSPKLSASTVNATLFGIALEAIAASATDTIAVKVAGGAQVN